MISIIVTCYNLEKYIKDCIKSILNQTYRDFELIIIDDCSTDNSVNIIKTFTDNRIRLFINKINIGAGLSRRKGIRKCLGEYVSFIDGDDYVSPIFVETLYNNIVKYNADISICSVKTSNEIDYIYDNKVFNNSNKFKYLIENNNRTVFLNNMLIKSTIWKKVKYCGRLKILQHYLIYYIIQIK